MLAEDVREVEQLARVPCEASELGEDQAGDAPRGDVLEHPLGLGMSHHRLPAHCFEVVDLADIPALRLGVGPGALLVVLRALASGLVLGRDADPDADGLGRRRALGEPQFLHGCDSLWGLILSLS